MYRVSIHVESTPVWFGDSESLNFALPPVVVARIRDQATFARDHGAREPKVEITFERVTAAAVRR